ncbi:MAG: elongation factor G [Thermomicrobiales bacterium]|nr:elongation factor G [Thermomicrobiales bacterium]
MKHYSADNIRNIGLFSHGGAGKTSLAEAMLHVSGATTRLGKIEDGNTVTDYDVDEIKRRMSISLALAPVEYAGHKINVVDVPGYADFLGEVQSALAVVDAAVILLDASAGVEVGSEKAWSMATAAGVPKILFVNKMDRENADFGRTIDSARSIFGPTVGPLQLPIGSEKSFRGVADILSGRAYLYDDSNPGKSIESDIPDEFKRPVREARGQLIEAAADSDEVLMERYLNDEEISDEDLRRAVDVAISSGSMVPVFAGAGGSMKGVDRLLQALIAYAPAASTRSVVAQGPDGDETLSADPTGPLAALVFKTVADPHVGRVSYFRVFSGSLKSNSSVYNEHSEKSERIGHAFFPRGKEHINADSIDAGDIGAIGKLAVTHTGDTLSDENHHLELQPIAFAHPSYSAAVAPKTKADLDKLGQALHRIVEEDPTLQLGRDSVTGESILSGLGEPHIQIALERMTRRYGVNVDLGLPRVQYRETISAKTNAEYKHKKQTGGAGQYGHVFLELEPLDASDFEFAERVVGGAVPRNFFPAVEKGVREALDAGPVAGYPVVNVKVTLYDGSYHDVDSNEMAFKIASKEAFKKGILMGKPILLEPVMNIEITVPDAFTGDVMSDLNAKRAQVSGMGPASEGSTRIEAVVPGAEIQRYATDLRSITQGRGSFTAEFSHYQPVPPNLAEQIKAEARAREESAA